MQTKVLRRNKNAFVNMVMARGKKVLPVVANDGIRMVVEMALKEVVIVIVAMKSYDCWL